MTKAELKTGMVVTTREGKKYMVFLNSLTVDVTRYANVLVRNDDTLKGWEPLDNYKEDFTHVKCEELDIMKVELVRHPYDFRTSNGEMEVAKTLWERQEVKELTVAEVSKLLGYEVKIVK